MRWTPSEAERAATELPLDLRVAGVGRLLHHLSVLGELPEPCAWCVGLVERRGALLLASDENLQLLMTSPAADRHVERSTQWRLADVCRVEATREGAVLHVDPSTSIAFHTTMRTQLSSLIAHLVMFIPDH